MIPNTIITVAMRLKNEFEIAVVNSVPATEVVLYVQSGVILTLFLRHTTAALYCDAQTFQYGPQQIYCIVLAVHCLLYCIMGSLYVCF